MNNDWMPSAKDIEVIEMRQPTEKEKIFLENLIVETMPVVVFVNPACVEKVNDGHS